MNEVKVKLSDSIDYDKKFTKSWDMSEYEIMTDNGFVDLEYLHQTIEYDVYELVTKNGKSLKCADNHIVFLSDMTEIFVKDLVNGDLIKTEDGSIDEVMSVNNLGYKESMYDFQLSENSDKRYYTNGILSHNTQLAKVLANNLFEGKDSLIRIDMSEYMEKFAVSRLIGSPPGYVGHEEGGQLTEAVRRKPYSVILLDEIEKAHPDVFNILLQMLDDGQLTDSTGRKVDFKNTIIIMTSNVGARQLSDFGEGVGFNTKASQENNEENTQSVIQSALKKAFAPEFLNRIDDVIFFNSLEKKDINKIIDIELDDLISRVDSLGYKMKFTKAAKSYLVDKGYDPKFGARPLKRAIQKYVEDPVSEEMVNNPSLEEGSMITIDYNKKEDEILVSITSKKKKPTTDSE